MLANTNKLKLSTDAPLSEGNESYEIRGLRIKFEVKQTHEFEKTFEAKLSGIYPKSNLQRNLMEERDYVDSTNWIELLRAAINNLSD